MAHNLISKYVWIIDTIRRRKCITLRELGSLWENSNVSDHQPLARRTFYNYRNGIFDTFNIDIRCNKSTFEYYIDEEQSDPSDLQLQEWLLNSMSISGALSDAHDVSGRILLEDVPSGRDSLQTIIGAMRVNHRIKFDYRSYRGSSIAHYGVVLEPYMVKIFKQLWYVVGYNTAEHVVKTYALDRLTALTVQSESFELPANFVPKQYFEESYGIYTTGECYDITIRVNDTTAKYLRALPMHQSQREVEVGDGYSTFSYRMKFTFDLMQAFLAMGPDVEILTPKVMRDEIADRLRRALAHYQ